jgi:hypothetical protein
MYWSLLGAKEGSQSPWTLCFFGILFYWIHQVLANSKQIDTNLYWSFLGAKEDFQSPWILCNS